MHKRWMILLGVAAIIGIGIFLVSNRLLRAWGGFWLARGLPSCDSRQELFSQPPLALSDFTHITPLGLLAPTAHTLPTTHLYFNVRTDDSRNEHSVPAEVPAVAPGDMVIREIAFTEALNRKDWSDFGARFAVCREVVGYFDHLHSLSPKLQAAYDAGETISCNEYTLGYGPSIGSIQYRFCRRQVEVPVTAGEVIGTAGGGIGQRVFDVGLFDSRVVPAQVANPRRWWWGRRHIAQAVCAVDYFALGVKVQLEPLLGGHPNNEGPRTIEPRCGQVIQDLPGTAQGTWVPPDERFIVHDTPHLALVHDPIDPRLAAFSVGERLAEAGIPPAVYRFTPRVSGYVNRDFSDIRADGKMYCFETQGPQLHRDQAATTTILLAMRSDTSLQIGPGPTGGCGAGPWPLDRFVEFVR